MKKLILGIFLVPLVGFAQLIVQPPSKITTDKVNPAIVVSGTTNQVAPYIAIKTERGTIATVTTNGVFVSGATTNQLVFAGTNAVPDNATNAVLWISVQVVGDTNAYRLPLYR